MILAQIIESKRREIEEAKSKLSQKALQEKLVFPEKKRSFKSAITNPHRISLIAEIKRCSPSRGIIREDFDPAKIALEYQANGASAISVLTDNPFFGGDLSHIRSVKEKTALPVLRKDFIIDEYQIYESQAASADALLLISELLSKEELRKFNSVCSELEMETFLEIHSEEEWEKVSELDFHIIGINNRDLRTFKVNLETTSRLIRLIPKEKVVVSESGIRTYEDVMWLRSLGIDAVLIGEAFMASRDIGAKMREVMGY